MNIYARYFAQDTLVHSYDELVAFLTSIPEIPVDQRLLDDVRAYMESDMPYPKRYKIRPRVYFILIKTTAETMEEFRAHRKSPALDVEARGEAGEESPLESGLTKRELRTAYLTEQCEGWYFVRVIFKRVIQIAATQKFRYQDTTFEAYVRAGSGQECYDRVIDHLKNRPEVDLRSQFPSARGSNFIYEYMGETLTK